MAPVVAAPPEGDWLSSICPYLQSEDGAYRSNQPDEDHRCSAQDPPGSLPLAFQERYCLTDRHPRCEMYKYAQEAAGIAPTPVGQLPGDIPAPGGRSISSALGSSGGGSRRPTLIAAAGIGGVAIIVFAFVLLLGSCSGDSETPGTDGASADPQLTEEPTAEPTREQKPTSEPTSEPTPEPTPTAEPDPGQSPDVSEAPEVPLVEILYEVQEGEALLKIAETFGVTRRRIIKVNEGMADKQPYVLAGDIIIVPVSAELTVEELEAVPGYQGLAP